MSATQDPGSSFAIAPMGRSYIARAGPAMPTGRSRTATNPHMWLHR